MNSGSWLDCSTYPGDDSWGSPARTETSREAPGAPSPLRPHRGVASRQLEAAGGGAGAVGA